MKIVCQSCSAKYSIADDKVQGKKVFKIKCKKCGEDILVRGSDAGAEERARHRRPPRKTNSAKTKRRGSFRAKPKMPSGTRS